MQTSRQRRESACLQTEKHFFSKLRAENTFLGMTYNWRDVTAMSSINNQHQSGGSGITKHELFALSGKHDT